MGGSPGQPDGPCLKGFAYSSQKLVVLPPVGPPGAVLPSFTIFPAAGAAVAGLTATAPA